MGHYDKQREEQAGREKMWDDNRLRGIMMDPIITDLIQIKNEMNIIKNEINTIRKELERRNAYIK